MRFSVDELAGAVINLNLLEVGLCISYWLNHSRLAELSFRGFRTLQGDFRGVL